MRTFNGLIAGTWNFATERSFSPKLQIFSFGTDAAES